MQASVTTVLRSATSEGSISSASASPARAWRISGTLLARAGTENSTRASASIDKCLTPGPPRLIAFPGTAEQAAHPAGAHVGPEATGAALGRRQRGDLVWRQG